MPDRNRIGYLPPQLAAEIRRWAPDNVLSDDEVFRLSRLAEQIFAAGYDSGFLAGYDEGRDAVRRPNVNEVNRRREAMAAKAGEGHA